MFDIQDGPVGTEEWIYNYLNFDQKEQFVNTPRNIYYYKSDDQDELRVGGYYQQVGNFMFCIVVHSGHLIPSTQLAMSRSLLKDIHETK